jgi:hypothetical protein
MARVGRLFFVLTAHMSLSQLFSGEIAIIRGLANNSLHHPSSNGFNEYFYDAIC